MTKTRTTRLALVAAATALSAAFLTPGIAAARSVTLSTQLTNYGGKGAYVAIYLTDADGAYQGSLWMAGGKAKYYKHLRGWMRATGGDRAQVDGITGASVGSGQSLSVTVDIADALIDAGYQIRVDTAAEEMAENPADVVVDLTAAGAGKAVAGNGYVSAFQYDM
ncbi:DUF2271 domain-containing protein [Rhodobacter ferrooxidans]|uniref:Tat (Twin-arginine translocation) pathway signal sequence domain protein n=1 Tax=Rhodobacter ferrooxidans TaxID=371731 RepID=C8RZQ0_9RHOB|nr:DUF2271 domain-containing protein [Rhodobacter sp. SW2]EEW25847.1 conserved hypothetical protein [Rhodobacter sp. SW2]